jgi:hypothetical protein
MKDKKNSSLDQIKSELKKDNSSLTGQALDKLKGGGSSEGHTYTYSKGNTKN